MDLQELEGHLLFQFKFPELVRFMRQILKTWSICGTENDCDEGKMKGIDRIKEKIPIVVREIQHRIQLAWNTEIIDKNIKLGIELPIEVVNLPNIGEKDLINEILIDPPNVNAITNESGFEEIYYILNKKKYKMQENGQISIENLV